MNPEYEMNESTGEVEATGITEPSPPEVTGTTETAPAEKYPGINFDVCRTMVSQGRSRREVAEWLAYHYPGYFENAEKAETAF